MKLSDFDYNLPKELIAQYPAEKRDESRLLVLHKDTGEIEHRIFRDIIEYLNPGDLLVLNNTKVLPARLMGRKDTGGKIEALVLNIGIEHRAEGIGERDEYEALLKPARGCKIGSKIIFGDGELNAEVTRIENGRRFLKFDPSTALCAAQDQAQTSSGLETGACRGIDCNGNLEKALNKLGQMPLPPYIKRQTNDSDIERYQTVYASKNGAVAAPTAGLHFTKKLLEEISEKRVDVEYVTLHVGYGTFKPVSNENITEHEMEKEYFEIERKVTEAIKNKKGRLIAVGTTSVRVLESKEIALLVSLARNDVEGGHCEANPKQSHNGWTSLFIYPGYKFKAVDALLTNFHLPKTTLLMLVAAFCGRELLFKTYQEAIREKYRFYSYGDTMLII